MKASKTIDGLNPYKPGMSIEELAKLHNLDEDKIIKLASNENPYGPSPKILKALDSLEIGRYPDQSKLLSKLASYHGISSSQIIIGNGSNDVLDLIARVFLDDSKSSIYSQYAFIVYGLVTKMAHAKPIVIEAKDYGHDLDGFTKAITSNTGVIWIANPNNPTGTFIDYPMLKSFISSIPKDIVVVLDEAYYEYLEESDSIDTTLWLKEFPNLVIVRTFSKIYGLAGLRIGYGMASTEIISQLNVARQPFNANSVGMMSAIAALDDQKHAKFSKNQNTLGLNTLCNRIAELGLEMIPSHGNFVTIRINNPLAVADKLLKAGIIVRPLQEYGLPEHLRISVGTPQQNQTLLDELAKIVY